MFYSVCDELVSINVEDAECEDLVLGYINKNELKSVAEKLNFNKKILIECEKEKKNFKEHIDSFDDCVFSTFKLFYNNSFDCFGLIISENMFLVIDIFSDNDGVRKIFSDCLSKINCIDACIEKLVLLFFDSLFDYSNLEIENMQNKIKKLEQAVEKDKTKENFNLQLLNTKNKLLNMSKFYDFIMDFAQMLADNYNDIFDKRELKYFNYLIRKAQRLKGICDELKNNIIHLMDAYNSYLELKLNGTMKFLTVLTLIFSPLSLITSWYGMNFKNMLLINWDYGYVLVFLLSLIILIIVIIIFKKKKLF